MHIKDSKLLPTFQHVNSAICKHTICRVDEF